MERITILALRKEVRRNCEILDQIRIKELVATRGIQREMEETYGFKEFCIHCVIRHRNYDWGDLCEEDKQSNDWAFEHDERLLSVYNIPQEFCIGYADKIWIITEWDRSITTILLPHEY